MPWADARSASSLPPAPPRWTGAAVAERSGASSVEAAASVLPATSSMSWAWTCRLLRKTASRGRAAVPDTFLRTRAWRRMRAACGVLLLLTSNSSLRGLSCLLADALAFVADTLLLVGVGFAQRPDLGSDLAHPLLVGAPDRDPRRRRHLEGDALGGGVPDGVGVAERQLDAVGTGRAAVADAVDLELALEALGHADHHVGHQRAGQPVQRAVLPRVRGPDGEERVALAPERDGRRNGPLEGRLRPLHPYEPRLDVDVHPAGHGDGHPSDTTHS